MHADMEPDTGMGTNINAVMIVATAATSGDTMAISMTMIVTAAADVIDGPCWFFGSFLL
jgi:hypothetical protein